MIFLAYKKIWLFVVAIKKDKKIHGPFAKKHICICLAAVTLKINVNSCISLECD